ncbi:MAG: hypothetical protein M1820_003382 [Bogoriella megaspora]|nr:MAG: hypothetical protein M1820_003382 [Bogoriella megaspora]
MDHPFLAALDQRRAVTTPSQDITRRTTNNLSVHVNYFEDNNDDDEDDDDSNDDKRPLQKLPFERALESAYMTSKRFEKFESLLKAELAATGKFIWFDLCSPRNWIQEEIFEAVSKAVDRSQTYARINKSLRRAAEFLWLQRAAMLIEGVGEGSISDYVGCLSQRDPEATRLLEHEKGTDLILAWVTALGPGRQKHTICERVATCHLLMRRVHGRSCGGESIDERSLRAKLIGHSRPD